LRRGQPTPVLAQQHGLDIEDIEFDNMRVDFFDRTVARKNFDIVLAPVTGKLSPVVLPSAGSPIGMAFSAPVVTAAGAQSGSVSINGAIVPRGGSDLTVQLHSVDIRTVEPYLDKQGETGITGGTVELSARSVVQDSKVNATGVLTLHNLRIGSGESLTDKVMGLPRRIAIERLTDRKGDIVLHFTIAGDAKDPRFSLNENASMRFSAGLAEALGVPVEALAKGVGAVGEQGIDAAGHVATGVGNVVKGLLPH
jgi:hypothetical protein